LRRKHNPLFQNIITEKPIKPAAAATPIFTPAQHRQPAGCAYEKRSLFIKNRTFFHEIRKFSRILRDNIST